MMAAVTHQAAGGERRAKDSRPAEPTLPLQRACACASSSSPCATCAADDETTLHRDADGTVTSRSAGASVSTVLAEAGQPLSAKARATFESALAYRFGEVSVGPASHGASISRFRVSERDDPNEREADEVSNGLRMDAHVSDPGAKRLDLSNVRIHAGSAASAAARAVGARAFTVGSHVVFGSGRFEPETAAGRKLLAHELTHVLRGADRSGTSLHRDEERKEKSVLPTDPNCEDRLDYTVDFKRFVRDSHKIVRGMPGLTKQQQDDLIEMADYTFAPEGDADINQYKILSCSKIHSTLNPGDAVVKAQVDSAVKEVRIVRDLADDMVALTEGTSTDKEKFVEVLRIFAHEMRHVSLGSAMNARLEGMKDQNDPKRKQELVTYRAQEILADVEELAVARKALGPEYEVSLAEQLELFRSANMIRGWAKPEEWQRLRTQILTELRKRYGPRKGDCDTSLTLGVMRTIDRGGWFWCDMGPKRVIGEIPQGVKVCEENGRHPVCGDNNNANNKQKQ